MNDCLETSLLLNQVIYEIDRENFLEMDFNGHLNFIQENNIQIIKLNTGDRLSSVFKFLKENKNAFPMVICLSDSIQFPKEKHPRIFANIISEEEVEKADKKNEKSQEFVYAIRESCLAYILK